MKCVRSGKRIAEGENFLAYSNETIHFTFLVKLDILKYASTILRSQCIYLEEGSLPIYLSLSIENCLKISWRETRRIETRYLTKIKMLSLVDNFWLPDLQQSQWIIKGKIFFSIKNKRPGIGKYITNYTPITETVEGGWSFVTTLSAGDEIFQS